MLRYYGDKRVTALLYINPVLGPRVGIAGKVKIDRGSVTGGRNLVSAILAIDENRETAVIFKSTGVEIDDHSVIGVHDTIILDCDRVT